MAGKERFHGGHFPKCIVLQAIFWYLRYSLSYRDIEELMKERGVEMGATPFSGIKSAA